MGFIMDTQRVIRPYENWRTLDADSRLMPWYTRPCLEWLDKLDLKGKNVFEYGCGHSTDWFESRGAITYGVDDKTEWCPLDERHIFATDGAEYIGDAIRWHHKKFYLIIIDGQFRDECTYNALPYLENGGYLIADNFEQASADLPDWPKTRELTKHLPLTLYKEPTHPDWVTAVWHNV